MAERTCTLCAVASAEPTKRLGAMSGATQKQVGYRVPRPSEADGERKQREEQEKVDNGVFAENARD